MVDLLGVVESSGSVEELDGCVEYEGLRCCECARCGCVRRLYDTAYGCVCLSCFHR